jgi:CDK5 regulatory subunit-associated protein 3
LSWQNLGKTSLESVRKMNEQDIPIDIHVNKLQDWLVSRRIVDKNWQRQVKEVRNNINEALKDMPANDQLVKLLSGARESIALLCLSNEFDIIRTF